MSCVRTITDMPAYKRNWMRERRMDSTYRKPEREIQRVKKRAKLRRKHLAACKNRCFSCGSSVSLREIERMRESKGGALEAVKVFWCGSC